MNGYKYLEQVNSPQDIRTLTIDELKILAEEIRDYIIRTIAKKGGHFASNLGVVELTLAIHYVFNTPEDKLIWDVSHQSYPHKVITGRRDRLHTIKQYKGISGYCYPSESEYDAFHAGHSSTSLSAALGFAEAFHHKNEDRQVIAVIGDGALTAGLAYEALNNISDQQKNLTVILNDNGMSIAPNVGAIADYLKKIDSRFPFSKREDLHDSVLYNGSNLETTIFEKLGLKYQGPLDGHNISQLVEAFQKLKDTRGPHMLHCLTVKGKGFTPAERDPMAYHGVSSFDVETGEFKKKSGPPTYTEVFVETLIELGRKDDSIIAVTAAMPDGTGLKKFHRHFPERCYDVGIAEQHAVSFAAGAAKSGLKPVVAIYSTFLQRAFDQVLHDVALGNVPVVFALDRAGIVGPDGPTHNGAFDISYLRLIPNMVVMAPKDENELAHMLNTALKHDGPIALRYPRCRSLGLELDTEYETIPIGKAEKIRCGSDIMLVALGSMVPEAVKVAEKLSKNGISTGVVNARFAKPIDVQLLKKLSEQVKAFVTIEENVLQGGFGSAVLESLQEQEIYNLPVLRIGIGDQFVEHGERDIILEDVGLTANRIAPKVMKFWDSLQTSAPKQAPDIEKNTRNEPCVITQET